MDDEFVVCPGRICGLSDRNFKPNKKTSKMSESRFNRKMIARLVIQLGPLLLLVIPTSCAAQNADQSSNNQNKNAVQSNPPASDRTDVLIATLASDITHNAIDNSNKQTQANLSAAGSSYYDLSQDPFANEKNQSSASSYGISNNSHSTGGPASAKTDDADISSELVNTAQDRLYVMKSLLNAASMSEDKVPNGK